jgi:hypothetical protein
MSDTEPESSERDTAGRVRRGLDYALLGGLVLLGAFAAIQFYFAADRTINVWVTSEYRPPFKMLFNLVVLLVVGIGLSRQVRRLTTADDATGTDANDERDAGTDATADGGVDSASTAAAERSAPTPTTARERAEDADAPGDEPPSDADRS